MNILCELGGVSRCGYYKWLKHADEPEKDYSDYPKVREVFDKGKGKYGWRSIKMRLGAMNHKKIQRIMRGYECTEDCSGHEAGYEWAEENDIEDESDCDGNSNSFNEGCSSYVEENY